LKPRDLGLARARASCFDSTYEGLKPRRASVAFARHTVSTVPMRA